MNINRYFNFEKLFKDIIKQEQESIKKFKYESDVYRNLDDFLDQYELELYDICHEDCEFNRLDGTFLFIFVSKDEELCIKIEFNNYLSEFTHFTKS